MSEYSLEAGFESIESPELIAASLYILQQEGWHITHFTDSGLNAEKSTTGGITAHVDMLVRKDEIRIRCQADIESSACKFIVDSLAQKMHQFIESPRFDQQIRELKHYYFMDNPPPTEHTYPSGSRPSVVETLFSFRKSFRVTPAIILINFLVFAAMLFSGVHFFMPKTIDILNWGGNFRSYVLHGQWWRLITCTFIHVGILHILFNMWALFDIGSFLERMIGSWRFAFAYLIAGLAGSMNSIFWHYATPSAGASGAIFGMFGLFLALLTTNLLEKGFRNSMLKSVLPMIVVNLLIGTSAQIDNAGHIGGLLAGLLCGYLYAWHYKNPRNTLINLMSFLVPVLLTGAAIAAIATKLPDPYFEYNRIFDRISYCEKNALRLQTKPENTDSMKLASDMWTEAQSELAKADQLGLQKEITEKNDLMKIYLQKRHQENLWLQDYSGNQENLRRNSRSIDSLLNLLNSRE